MNSFRGNSGTRGRVVEEHSGQSRPRRLMARIQVIHPAEIRSPATKAGRTNGGKENGPDCMENRISRRQKHMISLSKLGVPGVKVQNNVDEGAKAEPSVV